MKKICLALLLSPISLLTAQSINSFDPSSYASPKDIPWEIHFDKDLDNDSNKETAGSILLQQFNSTGGSISFDFTFLTSEGIETDTVNTVSESLVDPYVVHDVFRVGVWELDNTGNRTGEFVFLTGGAVNNMSDGGTGTYFGDFTSMNFANGGDLPGPWSTQYYSTVITESTSTEEIPTTNNALYFSSGAVTGSYAGTIGPGFWEIEFLVSHSEDYVVPSSLAIDNVLAPGLLNGNFENGLSDWFFIGQVDIFSNLNGPHNPIINADLFYDPLNIGNSHTYLPAPGEPFGATNPNTYVLVTAPSFYFDAVPEPSTYFLFLSGLIMGGFWFWKRKKSTKA